jgi:hypothetical protein
MHTDGGDLGVIGWLHPFADHRDELPVDPDAQKRPQFMGSRGERTGICQFCQVQHRGDVIGTERQDFGRPG